MGPLAARTSLGGRRARLLPRRLDRLPLPAPPARRRRAQADRAAPRAAGQRAAAHLAAGGRSEDRQRRCARGAGEEAGLAAARVGEGLAVRQRGGRRGDDRRGACPGRPRADHRGRLGRGLRPDGQGAGERRQGAPRRLLRERLMASVLDVQRVAVVGAGIMGTGIAQVAARAGYRTELFDVAPGAASRALERISESLGRAVEKGRCTAQERSEAVARLAASSELDASVAAADLVIEAAPEDLALKKELFTRLSRAARAEAILASNTSSLPITAIAAAARHPGRVVGLHFFNPVPAMKLLEIVQGERTDGMVVTACRAVGARLGKEVVVVRDAPGFASSRLGIALALEAIRMVEEGVASAEEIDRAIELGYGHPMGPLKLTDHVGLDVRLAIAEHLLSELGERFRPPQLLRRMVRAGKLGKKSGEGFYKYHRE